MKRGQGIPVNVIIIAAIALLVLVILIAIFGGKIGLFTKGYDETSDSEQNKVCNAVGGYCGENCAEAFQRPAAGWIDCSAKQRCCARSIPGI